MEKKKVLIGVIVLVIIVVAIIIGVVIIQNNEKEKVKELVTEYFSLVNDKNYDELFIFKSCFYEYE